MEEDPFNYIVYVLNYIAMRMNMVQSIAEILLIKENPNFFGHLEFLFESNLKCPIHKPWPYFYWKQNMNNL